MLDQLLNLVKENAQSAVINNPAVPNEQNEAVIHAATESIASGLQDEMANGNTSQVVSLLGGAGSATDPQNPVVNKLSGNLAGTLLEKFNLPAGTAQQIAGSLIPAVLGSLVKKTNDPNDHSFNLQSILNSLTGGQASGINLSGILGRLSGGLDKDGDGDVDLQDLMGVLSNGAKQQQQQQPSGGGLGGMLKDLLG
ncbi:hypothetical protein SAMN04488505_101587 [Chitinophaga rupis]|uniref:EF-hand domain-containing protein n=1 Tax=Chitinophaga rupis TaxID=573321 RepID=A0A1H7ILC2_9BACT|nr:hypothetical protein [Chitinophaga rupis]SEK63301.1 hypothetical protein SAMN04488505_101587 [Chitinophaga rupis]